MRRWTLRKLSNITGIEISHLSKIERGLKTPGGITQERIADALGIDRDVLFPAEALPEPEEATA